MPGGLGYRARTRDLFSRAYKAHGSIPLTTYLWTYKLGDYVDIKVNGAVQKGMPHKVYQGRTGVVWNITKNAVGVEINKQVRGRILKKRIHVRIEHLQPSRCREDLYKRIRDNYRLKREAGVQKTTKRLPKGPACAYILAKSVIETVTPIPYDI